MVRHLLQDVAAVLEMFYIAKKVGVLRKGILNGSNPS
jgi:hypothetical protein